MDKKNKIAIDLLQNSERNFQKMLHLTANENVISNTCRSAENSPLSSRYLLGGLNNPEASDDAEGKGFSLNGMKSVRSLLLMADTAVKKIFHAKYADFFR